MITGHLPPPVPTELVDAGRAVVVGSGIAGLSTALELGHCTVVTKTSLGDGASRWAQGGIAAALGPDDEPALHADDTVAVGGGLSVAEVARGIAGDAADRIGWLRGLDAGFDTAPDGSLALGREAGHGRRRIVHANGDATGAEVMRALVAAVRRRRDIEVLEDTHAIDLVRRHDRVVGVLVADADGRRTALLAPAVVLATGGIGRLYASTTNPAEATGDGLAMARRAGARIQDPEFVQFHPTALASTLDPMPLLTEALRGEGAVLLDAAGRRYLPELHPDAELAPRDVVARANWHEQQRGPISLDLRGLGADLPERFPTVFGHAMAAGLDPRHEPLPVSPAQHYHMGGIATDDRGRTSIDGLYACGEVASTGLHGANRLASNSLVEGLVVAARIAGTIRSTAGGAIGAPTVPDAVGLEAPVSADRLTGRDDDEAVGALRRLMWDRGGLVRDGAGLEAGLAELAGLRGRLVTGVAGRNLADVGELILQAAWSRRESRGSHHRTDHPQPVNGPAVHTVVEPDAVPTRPLQVVTPAAAAAS